MRKKIVVRGPVLSRSGYGEQTRYALRSLRAYENIFDIHLIPVGWGQTGWMFEDNEERRWFDFLSKKTGMHTQNGGQFDMSLQVTIPNEWEKLAPINIGYTAGIETDKIAPIWVEKSRLMDRIIVISEHAKYGFDNTTYQATNSETGETYPDFRCTTPVVPVSYPYKPIETQNVNLNLDFDFNFLCVAQWSVRKNLENTVKGFVEEFKNEEVGLVLKTNCRNNSVLDRSLTNQQLEDLLKPYADRKCKVYLLHGDMTEEEMTGLYNHPKLKGLVTAAHGEGFGLPIFEAAYNGLPVIAPDWSGHVDFLYAPKKDKKGNLKSKPHFIKIDYDLAPIQQTAVWDGVLNADSRWCYPKQQSYQSSLRKLYKSSKMYKGIANKLQKHIQTEFAADKMYKKFVEAMGVNVEDQVTEDLVVFD